ncbi:putative NF-X1 finger and helicase domain protein [Phyllosticta citribraziliensis]|uniref:NF-X1 finger and helicase domain protein n=1 Tax=Phyllosticta citribraziliensis TaxID=989973 RepID=A0ABR1LZ15_9PEZI
MTTYGEIDPDEDPCIFPSCGHVLTVESMDGIMGMSEHYDFAEDRSIVGIKSTSADPMSSDKIKGCAKCRGSLRDVCRYGRIVRRGLLDESTKKFISWSGKEYTNLSGKLDTLQQQLVDTYDRVTVHPNQQDEKPKLNVTGAPLMQKRQVMRTARELGLTERYSAIFLVRETVRRHSRKVHQEEQPFKKVFNLCEDARRRRQLTSTFEVPRDMVQTGAHVRATGLLLRCDLAVLSDVVTVYREKVPLTHRAEVVVDLRENRKICNELLHEARSSAQPRQWVEAHVFFAQYAAMEATVIDEERAGPLREEGNAHIAAARLVCQEHPVTTRGMDEQIVATERMLRDSTFYSVVTSDEMRAVVAAMGREFSGTGHWYYCRNGHPFTVGECGGPMQQSTCPECGAPVGGRHHEAAEGVTQAADLDTQFGRLNMG